MVTELKRIEGWSVVTQWGGARFVDFVNLYQPATRSGKPPDPQKRPEDLARYVTTGPSAVTTGMQAIDNGRMHFLR